jgi:hypothetical protein
MNHLRAGISWAGLVAGPGAWAASTQLNYALADWSCRHEPRLIPVAALVLALVALAGAFLSARAWRASGADQSRLESDGAPHRFLAGVSLMLAVLFAIVIMTQGTAALLLDGCGR